MGIEVWADVFDVLCLHVLSQASDFEYDSKTRSKFELHFFLFWEHQPYRLHVLDSPNLQKNNHFTAHPCIYRTPTKKRSTLIPGRALPELNII